METKFKLGQRVKVIYGTSEAFTGRVVKIEPPSATFYRVEERDKDGKIFAMTVQEDWLEAEEEEKAGSEFRKGQLVAVRDNNAQEWQLRVYKCREDGRYFCRLPSYTGTARWNQCRPAESIWPDIFLGGRQTSEDLK